jgi:hypothetical protein
MLRVEGGEYFQKIKKEITHMRIAAVLKLLTVGAVLLGSFSTHAAAVLNDWCLNLNGDSSSACNPVAPASLPANVNGSAFDFTLNNPPGTPNTLGSVTITLGPGSGQSVLAYMDYDLNSGASGSFQDVGSVHGTVPAGVSYELADPSGSIFGDFAANALPNTNGVATGSGPPTPCCDVSWALGVGGLNVAAGSQALVLFTVSSTKPTSGFYLQQSNIQSGESIYLTESVTTGAPVPLPASLWLLVSALGPLLLVNRRKRKELLALRN